MSRYVDEEGIEHNKTDLYIKVGKRYKALTHNEWACLYGYGRPYNGIWRIDNNSSTWLGELVPPERVKVQELEKYVVKALSECERKMYTSGMSMNEMAKKILDSISEYYINLEEGKKSDGEESTF
jgi:TRAP-type mannitol/chloroaromatic compound transport system substrate-binding protein